MSDNEREARGCMLGRFRQFVIDEPASFELIMGVSSNVIDESRRLTNEVCECIAVYRQLVIDEMLPHPWACSP